MSKRKMIDRVEKARQWAFNHPIMYIVIIVVFTLTVAFAFIDGLNNVASIVRKSWASIFEEKLATQKELEEWAQTYRSKEDKGKHQQPDESTIVKKTNDRVREIYQYFISSINGAVVAHQKEHCASIYVQIPDLPEKLFSGVQYTGAVTFSKNAAWSIHFPERKDYENKIVQGLSFVFMNGDGHTTGGTADGMIFLYCDTENQTVCIVSDGAGVIISDHKKIPMSDFPKLCPNLTKSILQYQLDHFK